LIRVVLLFVALTIAGPALSEDATALTPSDFFGTWQLDRARSDPTSAMLKELEVPWYARAASSSFSPTLHIVALGAGIEVTTTNPIGADETRKMPGDGSQADGVDPLGRKFTETTNWQKDGTLILRRRVELDGGRSAQITGTWTRSDKDLVIQNVIQKGEDAAVTVRRVFAPVAKNAS